MSLESLSKDELIKKLQEELSLERQRNTEEKKRNEELQQVVRSLKDQISQLARGERGSLHNGLHTRCFHHKCAHI